MTPQSHFTILAPVAAGREESLEADLAALNAAPGIADARNALLPFGDFDRLHYARLVLLRDATLGDLRAYGMAVPVYPVYLAFIGDCDGPARETLARMVERAGPGMRRIFGHCEGLGQAQDLLAWLLARDQPVAAAYVNTRGRTVRQIREEAELQLALSRRIDRGPMNGPAAAQRRRAELIEFVAGEQRQGRLPLTEPEPTPLAWWLANAAHAVAVPLLLLAAAPFLLLLSPAILLVLRRLEKTDPQICPRPEPAALLALQELEDRDISNQYSALGSIKPGFFRAALLQFLLVLIDYSCRHLFMRGFLARVQTIHFARWVFIDDKRRVVFVSNYDGRHEAYMDDFINKVGWGLNLVFSNGVGWPRTSFLLLGGARLEMPFKYYQRRHQLPTQSWYKAYPGLSLADLSRNARIRAGLQAGPMSEAQARAWLQLL
jgi:hypothetical protein